jgi:hypothetical protein
MRFEADTPAALAAIQGFMEGQVRTIIADTEREGLD